MCPLSSIISNALFLHDLLIPNCERVAELVIHVEFPSGFRSSHHVFFEIERHAVLSRHA